MTQEEIQTNLKNDPENQNLLLSLAKIELDRSADHSACTIVQTILAIQRTMQPEQLGELFSIVSSLNTGRLYQDFLTFLNQHPSSDEVNQLITVVEQSIFRASKISQAKEASPMNIQQPRHEVSERNQKITTDTTHPRFANLDLKYSDKWKKPWFLNGMEISKNPEDMTVINGVSGFLTPGDVQMLWDLASEMPKGGRYLEVGSWMGLSTIITANALMANFNFDARIYAVDIWEHSTDYSDYKVVQDGALYRTFLQNIHNANMQHFVRPVKGKSGDMLPFIDEKFDVIFIDGDHSFEGSYIDIKQALPMLKPGGRILGHDSDTGVGDAIRKIAQEFGYEYKIYEPPTSWYIWELFGVNQ